MTEVDKARGRNDAMLEAEQHMNSRFQSMISELRESWNKEEQARALAADGRLRATLKPCWSTLSSNFRWL